MIIIYQSIQFIPNYMKYHQLSLNKLFNIKEKSLCMNIVNYLYVKSRYMLKSGYTQSFINFHWGSLQFFNSWFLICILQSDMNQFFSAIDVHVDSKCILDVTQNAEYPYLASLGIDNLIYRLNIETGTQDRFNLNQQITFDAMALAPDASHCLFGGKNNAVMQYNFADGQEIKLYDTKGNITALKYAPSGKYIAIGTEEGKALLYDPNTGKSEKCRPGHAGTIYSIALSKTGTLLASIGADQHCLIYKINQQGQPMEVARYPITKLDKNTDLTCSFNFTENILFSSGARQLQKIECIQNRWDYSKSKSIMHPSQIMMVQVVKSNTLVTSTSSQFCVWSIKQQQKLFQIQQFCLTRVVPISGKFYGSHDDGKIYEYKRELREEEPMDIQPQSANDRIQFQEQQAEGNNEDQQQHEDAQQQRRKQIQYRQHKKSKADKMITCLPQPMISNATEFFNDSRFLFVNHYGCVIQRQEGDEEKFIDVELQGINKKQMKIILGKNKNYTQFSINELGVVYADDKQLGFRPSSETNNEQWLLQWSGVEALAMGSGWIAAANVTTNSQIKIFDMAGHQIRTISFDRQLVAMRAFENILVMVYHESVPIWDCQQLSMQLYLIDAKIKQAHLISNAHVPITRKSLLRWLDFSRQGMIFSQDSVGVIRAFSLEASEWTQICVDNIEEIRKVWIIGIKNYAINFWKITDVDPQPTVAPRFQVKTSEFSIPTIGVHPEETQQTYEKLLWRRYILDHEKARARLWGQLRMSRPRTNLFYGLTQSIQTEKRIAEMHIQLDEKYYPLIQRYLKARQYLKALLMCQNCIRSRDVSRKLVDLFDMDNHRNLAIQLEQFCNEMDKELDYDSMQQLDLMRLREEAERCIKPRSEDPMKRTAHRKIDSIPNLSQSSVSSQEFSNHSYQRMNSSKISNFSQNSLNSQTAQEMQNNQADNPFLKRKTNQVQTKKREISDQIEKFGLKQKVDKKSAKNM